MLDTNLFKENKIYPTYTPSEDEKTRTSYVLKRIAAMQQARTAVDKDWNIYQAMIDAIWTPYPDERSSSTVPLASSMIELFVAEATKIKTEFNFKSETSKYWANAKALEYTWKNLRRKNNWNRVLNESEYICAGFGNVPYYLWYESYTKVQKDMILDPDTGAIDWQENTIEKEWIVMELWDIRQFYIDNQAIKWIDDASDCAYRQRESRDKFQNKKNDTLYKNIEYVQPRWYSNDRKTFVNKEETIKEWDYVERRLYWNIEKDCYIELANWIEVREHPMVNTIDWEKALPRVWRGLGKKNYSVYSRWLCEPLLMFNSEINTLREMLMDWIRRSNSQVLAIGNGLKFNGWWFSYDNQILTFDGKINSDTFQQINGTPPNQAIFSYVEQLYRDISIYIGIDIQNVMWEPDLTAYQTEVKRESSQKRMNVRLNNRDYAYERMANLMKDLIQTYFPKKDANDMRPIIEIEDEKLQPAEWDKPARFKKNKWNTTFEVTPEILRWDIYIDVFTNVSAPTIGAVDRQQKKEFLTDIWIIAQQMAVAKQSWIDVESVMPVKSTLRDLAADFGLTVQNGWSEQEEVEQGKQAFMEKLMWIQKSMIQWEQPETLWQAPMEQPMQPSLDRNIPQWQIQSL